MNWWVEYRVTGGVQSDWCGVQSDWWGYRVTGGVQSNWWGIE